MSHVKPKNCADTLHKCEYANSFANLELNLQRKLLYVNLIAKFEANLLFAEGLQACRFVQTTTFARVQTGSKF